MKVPTKSLTEPSNVIRPVNRFEQTLLEDSLSKHGLLQPIVVSDGVIVDGYRRWLIAIGLGWPEIEVHEVEGDPDTLRIICQTRSTEFGRIEKKILVTQYLERHPDATAAEIGHAFTWPPVEVEQLVGVQYLVPEASAKYAAGEITLFDTYYLSRVVDHAQLDLLEGDPTTLHDRAEAVLREVKAARRRSTTTKPRCKSYNAVAKEAENPVYAGEHLIAADAKTPMDGWVAALKWVISGK